MKKRLSYRDKLIELAQIYGVKEIQDYIKRRKNLTSGQLELILKKNKIAIPKDLNTNFFKENFSKPFSKARSSVYDFKDDSLRSVNRTFRKIDDFKEATKQGFQQGLFGIWNNIGKAGLSFLNIIPKLGKSIYSFFVSLLTELFSSLYNQEISNARKVIIGFFVIVGVSTALISGFKVYDSGPFDKNTKEVFKKEPLAKDTKKEKKVAKPELKKKQEKKVVAKPELKKKKEKKITELILPDLNLKTETVLNLFEDVDYDLNQVRSEKIVKPIYFTQFPKDLDEIQSVKLKKETFIKIVLPLIVAENEKILDDKYRLKKIVSKKMTTDEEKQWLRQKFLEYKVKKGSVEELNIRMDIIPNSIALAQAAKESGWGTSRFALEGNAIFGQWTWTGNGIEPLLKDRSKKHKILRFPILRASVKSYLNNLNTHKSYIKFRTKRNKMRLRNKRIDGLKLTETLNNYAQTGDEYTKILEQIITQNRLMDFEPVKLVNSVSKIGLKL
tara:strand:+ start:2017 stop:3513 length:1497 start_codon:yes stop_codon:yes gene_type:complete